METEKEPNTTELVTQVKQLRVVDSQSYQSMANGVQLIRSAAKFFKQRLEPRIAEAWKLHKALTADLRKDLEPIEAAQRYGDQQLAAYDSAQEIKRAQEQLRQMQEAKKKIEEEKMQLAELAEKAGETKLAEMIIDQPSTEPSIVVAKDTPKVEGISFASVWKYEVTDLSLVPREYLILDATKVGKLVRALKETTKIPGIRAYEQKITKGKG